jgi:hypothetical protein
MAGSISARQITAAAKASAQKALEAHIAKPPKFDIGFCPPPWWWIGIIIRPPDDLKFADAEKMSVSLHRSIAAEVPAVKGGKPGAVLLDGNLTIGFVAPKEINILHE